MYVCFLIHKMGTHLLISVKRQRGIVYKSVSSITCLLLMYVL